jgi:glyoxylase-like metal-dependent hydrolase (beta-lactamase superfamily II)
MRVEFEWRKAGSCRHPEFMTIAGGSFRSVSFPSFYGRIRHPSQGWILFDTGYSTHFHAETRPFPERIYSWVTPMQLPDAETAAAQLAKDGVHAHDVHLVIISHFHGDHIAGLKDFPNARFICFKSAYDYIKVRPRWKNVAQGYLTGLLPGDFESRLIAAEACRTVSLDRRWLPFVTAFDLIGDGSLLALPLQGHARGQMGLILRSETDRDILLAADAVWNSESIRSLRLPHPLTRLIGDDARAYQATILKLHELRALAPDALLIPSHCREFPEGRL